MIYTVHLQAAGLVAALILIAGHAPALISPTTTSTWLAAFPRSRAAGTLLMAFAGLWALALALFMDMGEFWQLRNVMLLAVAAGSFLMWRYVPEFLAVRAFGMLLLLAAEPLLESAFLHPETSRLLLVVLAYAWIVAGLFFVGMPYLLRDAITWAIASGWRLKLLASGGILYGVALAVCALTLWGRH